MTTHDKIATVPYAERLNTAMRLRLIRNTTGELSALTGIELRNNSFSKKAPFIAKCIYSESSRETRERTGMELDDLLAEYQAASRYYNRIANSRKAQPEFHRTVLRCVLDAEYAGSEEGRMFRPAAEAAKKTDVAILTLLVLKMLPSYDSKSGEVDINSFVEHLARLRDYFRPLYHNSRVLRFAPYLTETYQKAVRSIRSGELFTRLELIGFARHIMGNLLNNYDPEQLLQANRYLDQCKIHPSLEGKCWVERNFHSPMPVCWTFEAVGMDYIAIRRQYDGAQKHITETRYELFLYRSDTERTFILMRQSAVENLCLGRPIPENVYMHGFHHIDNDDAPSVIRFDFTGNRYDDFPTCLTVADDAADRIAATIDDTWTTECETGEWEYLSSERVITSQYIYVECDSVMTDDGNCKVTSWYRIPREGLLNEVAIDSTIVRVRHDNRLYIGFVSQNCFLDVSDNTGREHFGISMQDGYRLNIDDIGISAMFLYAYLHAKQFDEPPLQKWLAQILSCIYSNALLLLLKSPCGDAIIDAYIARPKDCYIDDTAAKRESYVLSPNIIHLSPCLVGGEIG